MSSNQLYTINLEGLEFHAFHGCYDLEQLSGSHFEVALEIVSPLGDVAEKDDVTLAVNYLTVYEVVREQMAITQRTIERVAQNIINALFERFSQIAQVKCTVTKLAPPLGGKVRKVSVTLTSEQ
jgi:dihydroneopterin aldolase